MSVSARVAGLAVVVLTALGCGGRAKPPPPPPPPPPPAPAPPPPPPPKCEKIEEACVAKEGTRAKIEKTFWTVEPPAGWTYAQDEDATVAAQGGAALAVVVYDAPEPKKEGARRDEAATSVVKKIGVEIGKGKTKKLALPKRADGTVLAGTVKVSLYQFEKAHREGKPGPLLVFYAKLPDGKELLGAGFVPEDDTSKADDAIMASVKSIDETRAQIALPSDAGADAAAVAMGDAGAK